MENRTLLKEVAMWAHSPGRTAPRGSRRPGWFTAQRNGALTPSLSKNGPRPVKPHSPDGDVRQTRTYLCQEGQGLHAIHSAADTIAGGHRQHLLKAICV